MNRLYYLFLLVFSFHTAKAQYIFRENSLPDKVSIINYSAIADAGSKELPVTLVRSNSAGLIFHPITGKTGNLGFTDHTYWLKFSLKNQTQKTLLYYLETVEPVTDHVNLYLFGKAKSYSRQRTGDNIPFKQRSVAFRKSVFKIHLMPGENKEALMEIKNDGEKNSLPLYLISQERFLEFTYHDQLIMGIFYGILFIIAITYLFFYFALNERIFLYYSLYVGFVGLCQFALDGFFHQYLDQSDSWLNLHAVILFAIGSSYFFGKYSELVLNTERNSKALHAAFRILYVLLGIILAGLVLFPSFLKFSYPAVNILTLLGMLLIVGSIIHAGIQKQPLDLFYSLGISVLFICLMLVILLNFGIITSFTVENITKPGIGLEIIALSLSMANRIRVLKSKKEELQTIALQKSEEMNDMKSYFLSNMSHELRTPLNAILGLTNNLLTESADQNVKDNCGQIKTAAYSLISSVNDIMDFSQIEKGEIRLENIGFSIPDILARVSENYRRQAVTKGLTFEFSSNAASTLVTGDPGRLEQVLNNVLSNAVKFTSFGSVSLEADTRRTDDGQLSLTISIVDTGIGITAKKLDSVFEMFTQVDISDKRKFGGFGIGLCIVNALVNLQGGTIRLSSTENEGTTCVISLKYHLAPAKVREQLRFPEDVYDLLGKHVLIVEDNPMNQMVMKMMMKKWLNTTLSFANNGSESLDALKNNTVDLVLMDLQMPVMDGYEATEAIRNGHAGESNNQVPIIVLTADIMESTRERIIGLGADDYMTKPVDQKLLYQKITALLS